MAGGWGKNTQWGKDSPFDQQCWEKLISTCKSIKLASFISSTKISSNQIKDLNIRPETLKLLEDRIGGKPHDTSLGNDFLDITAEAQVTKAKVKWDYITKTLLHSKVKQSKVKRQPTEWEKIFGNHISDQRLVSKIYN